MSRMLRLVHFNWEIVIVSPEEETVVEGSWRVILENSWFSVENFGGGEVWR